MTFGLLQCDHVDGPNRHLAGDYLDMFSGWLPGQWRVYDLTADEFPAPGDCDAWVVTGSRRSVSDDIPWIHRLAELVRTIDATRAPFAGICFGHQMMAHALGGRVAKSPRGWGIGVHTFHVNQTEPWMKPPLATVNLFMSCQDQVEVLPPGARVHASNVHCPVAIYSRNSLLGIQGHPEWREPYARALLEQRMPRLGQAYASHALGTLGRARHSAEVASWVRNWFALHAR
ncbi:MAG: type 1 glutamine amidotransferase [Bryobacterales bacterium]|nr:type 1 glutamine amidotransferase [Bryobacterales bacterium]